MKLRKLGRFSLGDFPKLSKLPKFPTPPAGRQKSTRGVILNEVKDLTGCKAVRTKSGNTIRETLR